MPISPTHVPLRKPNMSTERKVLTLRRDTSDLPQITERLHKVLANAGLGSRRSLEERIAAGEIRINGEVAQVGALLNNGDRVEIDARRFAAVPCTPAETRVLMYHKPEGQITSNDDPEGRPTVFEKLPRLRGARWVSVGRLDINTTGLLLLTTDGELANALMHPSNGVEREYVCRVFGEVTDEHLQQLRKGIELDDGPAAFDDIIEIHRDEKHAWFRVILREGRNREVRRLWEALGLLVSRLKRIRYGQVELPRELRRGHHRALDADQVRSLRHSVGLGDAPQSLTLEPILGQRRAATKLLPNEYRPEPRAQRAWTGNSQDEARELRAFDRPLLDDGLGRRRKRAAGPGAGKRGKFAGKPGGKPARGRGGAGAGPGAGAAGRGERGPRPERGNRATAPGGKPPMKARRAPRKPKVMTGPMDSNEMLFRTWYPGGDGGRAVGNDDNRGNVARPTAPVDGNRAAPADGNRVEPADGNRAPSQRKRPAARAGKKPGPRKSAPRSEGNGNPVADAAGAPARSDAGNGNGNADNRSRRGPFRRVRKRGPREDGGGNAPGNSE